MINSHAVISRTALRGLAVVVALGCVQIVYAADRQIPYGNSVEYKQLSQVGAWKPLTGATPGGSGVVFQRAGATDVNPKISDLRLTQSGKGVDVKGTVNVPIGGSSKTIPVLTKAAITGVMYMRGVGAVLGGPAGLTLLAFPLLADLINSTPKFRVNSQTGDLERQTDLDGFNYRISPAYPWSPSKSAACSYAVQDRVRICYETNGPSGNCGGYSSSVSSDGASCLISKDGYPPNSYIFLDMRVTGGGDWMPASMDDIAPYMDTPDAPSLTPEIVYEGAGHNVDPFISGGPIVTASGPSSIPGGTTTTTQQTRVNEGTTTEAAPGSSTGTQPATKTTTTTTNHNVTYNNNQVTTNTTTTTTTNITNNITNQTDTTTDKVETKEESPEQSKEDESDLCEKNPDILACKKPELDTPEGDIPKTEKQLTYTEEDNFGGGSCPSDVYGTVRGQSIKMYDWAQTCGVVQTYLRPLILLLGAMGALFILIPGRDS